MLVLKWIDAWSKLLEVNKAVFLVLTACLKSRRESSFPTHNDNLEMQLRGRRGTEALQLGMTAPTTLSVAVIGDTFKRHMMILRLNCLLGDGSGASTLYSYRTLDPCVVFPKEQGIAHRSYGNPTLNKFRWPCGLISSRPQTKISSAANDCFHLLDYSYRITETRSFTSGASESSLGRSWT